MLIWLHICLKCLYDDSAYEDRSDDMRILSQSFKFVHVFICLHMGSLHIFSHRYEDGSHDMMIFFKL